MGLDIHSSNNSTSTGQNTLQCIALSPDHPRRLHVRLPFVRPRCHRQNAAQRDQPKRSAVRTLHIHNELAHIAEQRQMFGAAQLRQCVHEARDQRPEDGRHHLALRRAGRGAREIGGIAALAAACRCRVGRVGGAGRIRGGGRRMGIVMVTLVLLLVMLMVLLLVVPVFRRNDVSEMFKTRRARFLV